MKLSQHLKTVMESKISASKQTRYEQLLPRIIEYKHIFTCGYGPEILTVNDDMSITYTGNIEFTKQTYVDDTQKLPFTFRRVVGEFVLQIGYADKLESLEGLPSEFCEELFITLIETKPWTFFQGYFPAEVKIIDLSVKTLHNCNFGITKIREKFELTVDAFGVNSFEGLPDTVTQIVCNFPPHWVRTFKGLPKHIRSLTFWVDTGQGLEFELKDLIEHATYIDTISTSQPEIKADTPLLSLFKIKGLSKIKSTSTLLLDDGCYGVFKIIDKYLKIGNVIDCQEELIDRGLKQFAKTK